MDLTHQSAVVVWRIPRIVVLGFSHPRIVVLGFDVQYRVRAELHSCRVYVYKLSSIRKWTLGSISCNTTTSCSLQPIPLNWVPLELLQDSDSSSVTIGPHWPSSYPEYLSPHQGKDKQQRLVWARLLNQRSNLASRLSKQNERYQALRQELNPRTTQVESSHDPLYRDKSLSLSYDKMVSHMLPPRA